MHLTPKSRQILGFIEGFTLLHRVGPDFQQVWGYVHGAELQGYDIRAARRRQALEDNLTALLSSGRITRVGSRFQLVSPQRSVAFAYNRNTGMLEQFHGTETDPVELLGP